MNEDVKHRIAREMFELATVPTLAEDEITHSQYRDASGITHGRAVGELGRMLKAGLVERRKVFHNNNWTWAYRIVKKD